MFAAFRSPKKTSELEPSLILQIDEYVQASVDKHFSELDAKIDGIFEVVNKLDETTRSELREIKSFLNHSKPEATTLKSPETPILLEQPSPFIFDASPKGACPTIGKTRLLASPDMSSPGSNADAAQQKIIDLSEPFATSSASENNEEKPVNSAENGAHLSDSVSDSSNPVKSDEANDVSDYESVSEELQPATKSSSDTTAANSDIDYTDEASNKSSDTEEENNIAEEKSHEKPSVTQTSDNQRDDIRGGFCCTNSTPKRTEKPEKKLPKSSSTPHASPLEPLKEREKENEKLVENVAEEIRKEGGYCSDDAISDSDDSFSSTQQNLPVVITQCSLDNESESIDGDTEDEEYTTQQFSIVTAIDERKEDECQPDTVKVSAEKQKVIKSLGEKDVAEFDIVYVDKEPEVVLFKHECKLFTFVNERKETLSFGLGDVMIKSLFNQRKSHQVDIVFVRRSDQRICADFTIIEEMFLTDKTDAKNCGIMTCKDNSDDVAIPTIFIIKFREKESYDEFKRLYNDAVENARASVEHGRKNEKLTKSKLIAEAEQTGVPFKRPRTLCKSLSIQQPPAATFGSVNAETSFSTSYNSSATTSKTSISKCSSFG